MTEGTGLHAQVASAHDAAELRVCSAFQEETQAGLLFGRAKQSACARTMTDRARMRRWRPHTMARSCAFAAPFRRTRKLDCCMGVPSNLRVRER